MTDLETRWNAIVAVEDDPVRRWERQIDLRLGAAVMLAPTLIVAEALLTGVSVPAHRLNPETVQALHLEGDITLTDQLALLVVAYGPLKNIDAAA